MQLAHTSDTGSTNPPSTCVPFTLNNNVIRQLFKFKITVQNMIHASVQLNKITIHVSLTFFNCISKRIFNKDRQLSTILSDFY